MELARKASRRATAVRDDRRSEARLHGGGQLPITLLLEQGDEVVNGAVLNASGRGLSVTVERAVPVDTAVRLDLSGKMLLGEVIHCTRQGAAFVIGIELQQSVVWTRDLMRLLDALSNENGRLT